MVIDTLFFPAVFPHNSGGSDQRYWQMSMKRISLAATLAAALVAPCPAFADLAGAKIALENAEYDKAYGEIKPLAEGGDVEAQFEMGRIVENGWGTPASYQKALAWYRRAADRGHVAATVRVAEYYMNGYGIPRSRREAYDWYALAAQRGDVPSMTLVGRWNLEGIAKRPNFLAAKSWLNKAAAAGDAEAQAIVDDLASKNYPILEIPGTAEPTEEAAKRVLSEVKDLLDPMMQAQGGSAKVKLGMPATVTPAEGGHMVTLPLVEWTGDQGTWRLGTVQVVFTPAGADYAVELRLPSQSRLVSKDGNELGRLAIESRKLTGTWSTGLHTLTDYAAEFGKLRYTSIAGRPWEMTIEKLTASRSYTALGDGRYDVGELAEATNIRTEGGTAGGKDVMTLAAAAYTVRYAGLDVPALDSAAQQFGMDWRTGATVRRLAPRDLPESVAPMLRQVEVGLKLRDLVAEEADGERTTLAGSELTLIGDQLEEALSSLKVRYSHDGLAASGGSSLLPRQAAIEMSGHRLPAGEMASSLLRWWRGQAMALAGARVRPGRRGQMTVNFPTAADGMLPGMEPLAAAVRKANSELRIDKVVLTGDDYSVRLSGSFTPAAEGGAAGKVDIAVAGLDRLTAGQEPEKPADGEEIKPTIDPLELLARVKGMAVNEKDGSGADVKVFHVAIQPTGKILINGKDASKPLGR